MHPVTNIHALHVILNRDYVEPHGLTQSSESWLKSTPPTRSVAKWWETEKQRYGQPLMEDQQIVN